MADIRQKDESGVENMFSGTSQSSADRHSQRLTEKAAATGIPHPEAWMRTIQSGRYTLTKRSDGDFGLYDRYNAYTVLSQLEIAEALVADLLTQEQVDQLN